MFRLPGGLTTRPFARPNKKPLGISLLLMISTVFFPAPKCSDILRIVSAQAAGLDDDEGTPGNPLHII